MVFQQGAETSLLVGDTYRAKGMPVGRRIDGDDGLAQKKFSGGGQAHHRQVGTHLHDGVYVVTV